MNPLDFIASLSGEAKSAALTVYNLMQVELRNANSLISLVNSLTGNPFLEIEELDDIA